MKKTLIGRADLPCDGEEGSDHLGMRRYAQALARFVVHCETPMTIGIQGEWGSGKTSLMNMVTRLVEREDKEHIFTHWFQTWQYGAVGNDDTLGFHLMSDLVESITRAAPKEDGVVVRTSSRLRKALSVLARSAVVGGAGALSMGLLDGKTLVSEMSPEAPRLTQSGSSQLDQIRSSFQELVNHLVEKQGGRFVIFVDDLDRIVPGRAVLLLEILKNFMDVENCVFVVACDYEVVREGVAQRLGITDSEKVEAFFHKIFQVPFQMPIRSYNIENMLQQFLAEKIGQELEKLQRRFKKDEVTQQAHLRSTELSPLVKKATNTNPRAFKRFLNILELLSCVVEVDGDGKRGTKVPEPRWSDEKACRSLVGLVALQTRWPAVASYISSLENEKRLDAALQTLKGSLAEEDMDADDDQLKAILQSEYGSLEDLGAYREHPTVEALCGFAELFYALLDADKRDGLSEDEVASLLGWSRQLSLTGVGKSVAPKGGWYDFGATLRETGEATTVEGYLRTANALWNARDSMKSLQVIRTTSLFYTNLKVGDSKRVAVSFSNGFLLRLNLGPVACEEMGLPGLAPLVEAFVAQCQEFGASWELQGNKKTYQLKYDEAPLQETALVQFRAAIVLFHRELGELIHRAWQQTAALSTDPGSLEAPVPVDRPCAPEAPAVSPE